ncbi:MAG: hypothetical protein ABI273_21185 [Lacunisphaera sp.]
MNCPEEIKAPRLLFSRVFPTMGVVGLTITIALNLIASLALKKPAAEFFSHGWWSTWLPSYLVWSVLLLLGLAGVVMKKE